MWDFFTTYRVYTTKYLEEWDAVAFRQAQFHREMFKISLSKMSKIKITF